MKHTLHPILAVILGIVLGSLVNSSLVHLGEMLIPLPAGADTTSTAENPSDNVRFEARANHAVPSTVPISEPATNAAAAPTLT